MSVWQEFLIGMAYVYPIDQEEIELTDLVFKAFKILLHHAIKFEYGGWRVWIDTLSILHSRVAKEDYQLKMSKLYDDYEKNHDPNVSGQSGLEQDKENTSEQSGNAAQQAQQQQNNDSRCKIFNLIDKLFFNLSSSRLFHSESKPDFKKFKNY